MREQLTGVEAVLADGTVVSRLVGLGQGQHRLRPDPAARAAARAPWPSSPGSGCDWCRCCRPGRSRWSPWRHRQRADAARRGPGRAAVAVGGGTLRRRRAWTWSARTADCPHRSPRRTPPTWSGGAGRTDPTDELLAVLGECPAVAGRHRRLGRRRGGEAVGVPGDAHRGDQRRRRTGEAGRQRAAARTAGAGRGAAGHRRQGRTRRPGRSSSATWARATCTSTCWTPAMPRRQVTDAVLRLVAGQRGSISSEHGVGRAKPAGCPCPGRRRRSTRCAGSAPRWTRPAP